MKNIQIIDGAMNSIFEIYAVSDDIFNRLFPSGADIAFAEDFPESDLIWMGFYKNRVDKKNVEGIHGTLHLTKRTEINHYFPTRKEAEVK
jgi:hypothetical protein